MTTSPALRLVTDGESVWACRDDGQILDALRHGQLALFVAVDRFADEVDAEVRDVRRRPARVRRDPERARRAPGTRKAGSAPELSSHGGSRPTWHRGSSAATLPRSDVAGASLVVRAGSPDADVTSQLLAFVERTSDLVGVVDEQSRVLYLNEAARKRLGVGDSTGLTTADMFPPRGVRALLRRDPARAAARRDLARRARRAHRHRRSRSDGDDGRRALGPGR